MPPSPLPHARGWIQAWWMPVRNWDAAGAEVSFSGAEPEQDVRSHFDTVAKALERIGRFAKQPWPSLWSGAMPSFDGPLFNRRFNGETAALRRACGWLREDVEDLFEDLPDR